MNILGLTLKTLHLDSTSFHVDGEYNRYSHNSDENRVPIKITKGYSRDHHPELNQVVLNLMVEHQAGIPVWMKASNGKANPQLVNDILKKKL
jgi:transposase